MSLCPLGGGKNPLEDCDKRGRLVNSDMRESEFPLAVILRLCQPVLFTSWLSCMFDHRQILQKLPQTLAHPDRSAHFLEQWFQMCLIRMLIPNHPYISIEYLLMTKCTSGNRPQIGGSSSSGSTELWRRRRSPPPFSTSSSFYTPAGSSLGGKWGSSWSWATSAGAIKFQNVAHK